MENRLNVWLHDQLAGVLYQNKGQLSFKYGESYLSTPLVMPLSCSLPLQYPTFDHDITRAFFSGLLPEGEKRIQIAKVLHVTERNDFQLLRAIGGECAGAVSLLSEEETPNIEMAAEPIWLTEEAIKAIIDDMPRRPMLAGEHGVRLSLAGAQDKLPVVAEAGKIGVPLNNAPSTHILKPAIQDIDGTVYNEAFALELAKRLNLPCVNAEVGVACDTPYLLIARYDRAVSQGRPYRLHQEDFCQALSISPETKYQGEGGPGVSQCIELITKVVNNKQHAVRQFVDAAIFNYFIGNNDAHGKNFSLIHHDKETCSIAPFYDLLSTAVYPNLTDVMAMKIGSKKTFKEIEIRHWESFAQECHIEPEYVKGKLREFASQMPILSKQVIDTFKDKNWYHPICDAAFELIQKRTQAVQTKFKIYSQLNSDVVENYNEQKQEYIQSKYHQFDRLEKLITRQIERVAEQRHRAEPAAGLLSRLFKHKKPEPNVKRIVQLEKRLNFIRLIRTGMNGKMIEDLAIKKLRRKESHLAILYDAEIKTRTLNATKERNQHHSRGQSLTKSISR